MAKNKNRTGDGFLSRLKFLGSSFAIGIYVTICFSALSFFYYIEKEDLDTASLSTAILNDLDQKSLDYRLRFRGPRNGSERVAVLAVDNESLSEVGRWPWPRQKMAQIFENAFVSGARVIAADIVWSEPTDQPEEELASTLRREIQFSPEQDQVIEEKLLSLDADLAFVKMLEKFQDQFVAGSFYTDVDDEDLPVEKAYIEVCNRLAFEQTKAGKLFSEKGAPIAPVDATEFFMPGSIADAYREFLKTYDTPEATRKQQLQDFHKKLVFCATEFWSLSDPLWSPLVDAWPAILEQESTITANSFEEWVQQAKARFYLHQIPGSYYWVLNIDRFNAVTNYTGYFQATLDRDGTIRRVKLLTRAGAQVVPALSLLSYMVSEGKSAETNVAPNPKVIDKKGLTLLKINNEDGEEEFRIPAAADGSLLINYAGPQMMFPHVQAASLLDPNSDKILVSYRTFDKENKEWIQVINEPMDRKTFLKDKILIAGVTATAVYDLRVTPFEENFPGVETHANIVDNLIRQDFLSVHPDEQVKMPVFLLAFGLIMSFSLARSGALFGLLLTLFSLTSLIFVNQRFFFQNGIAVSIILPLFLVVSLYLVITFYKYLTEERGRKVLRQTFSKYVSPQIVSEILQDPKNLELGGRKENITVFFSDVRGFTTLSETLDPRELSDLLNSYLTPMTEIVFKNQGTLDKYIGDAVMAFFGAPIRSKNHAEHACRAALEQLEKLKELQETYRKKDLPVIDIGIGLNSGEASVGNMGSETVRNYTVMGDTVNLASRLEGITKEYGVRTVISETTYDAVKDKFICRLLDQVRVKGKLQPVKIYELLGEGKISPEFEEMRRRFEDGIHLYQARRFQDAIAAFEKALAANPNDRTSSIYIDRCREYVENPPPEGWDGVYVMTKK